MTSLGEEDLDAPTLTELRKDAEARYERQKAELKDSASQEEVERLKAAEEEVEHLRVAEKQAWCRAAVAMGKPGIDPMAQRLQEDRVRELRRKDQQEVMKSQVEAWRKSEAWRRVTVQASAQKRVEHLTEVLWYTHRYTLAFFKACAGAIKFILEDLLNVLTQFLYAVKCWDELTTTMRAFTVASLAAGLIASLASLVKDVRSTCRVRRRALSSGLTPAELTLDQRTCKKQLEEASARASSRADTPTSSQPARPDSSRSVSRADTLVATAEEEGEAEVPLMDAGDKMRLLPQHHLPDVELTEFVGSSLPRGCSTHVALLVSAILYWGGMASIPLLFANKMRSGVSASVPISSVLYFTTLTGFSVLTELWVAIQTYNGLLLFQDLPNRLASTCKEPAKAMSYMGIALSLISRYDTFSDVIFAVILCKTPPIKEISFEHTLQMTVHLPWALHEMSLFSLVVGVALAQAIPGLVLLATKRHLGAAFKLNEFCVLLGIVELDLAASASASAGESA